MDSVQEATAWFSDLTAPLFKMAFFWRVHQTTGHALEEVEETVTWFVPTMAFLFVLFCTAAVLIRVWRAVAFTQYELNCAFGQRIGNTQLNIHVAASPVRATLEDRRLLELAGAEEESLGMGEDDSQKGLAITRRKSEGPQIARNPVGMSRAQLESA